jgi:hypothetical protein
MAARALTPALTPGRNYPPSRAGNALMRVEPARGHSATCQWCGKRLRGRQERYCSPAHRSSMSRCKHRTAVQALASIGIPKQQAAAVVARYGLPAVEEKLNALGWVWWPRLRSWFDDTEIVKAKRIA